MLEILDGIARVYEKRGWQETACALNKTKTCLRCSRHTLQLIHC